MSGKTSKLLNENMGKNNILSVNLKDIFSLNPIKYEYPNNYNEKRDSVIVGGFKYQILNTRNDDEVVIVIEFRSKDPEGDPTFGTPLNEGFY